MKDLTPQEKLDLLNTLHPNVVEYDLDGDYCFYVHVPVNPETRRVLNALGYDDAFITKNTMTDILTTGTIDISPIGFKLADWWDKVTGFSYQTVQLT